MSIGEHDTCPYCGHSNLIISKNDAAVKALVEAAKELSDLMRDIIAGDYKPDSFTLQPIEQAIKKVEEL